MNARTTAAYTTEFHHEFRVETGRLLRRRFLWFTAIVGAFALAVFVYSIVGALAAAGTDTEPDDRVRDVRWWLLSVSTVGLYAFSFAYALQRRPTDEILLRLSLWVLTAWGVISVFVVAIGFEGTGLWGFFLTHLIACLLLPWTPQQALRPMMIVLAANAALVLLLPAHPARENVSVVTAALMLVPTLLYALPGGLTCWVRHSRRTQLFKYRFMTSRYSEMRRELVDARRIHESLFPEQVATGGLRLLFEYEPMRQIGGDFLFAHRQRSGGDLSPVSVVLLDVTGHGIPAALTVNRLHGEMERVFAENPDVGPGEVLSLLNRYVHLTLATHSIYVTAFCARIDPARSVLEYASGGHPPAFVRAVDGSIEELPSTSFVLGACPGDAFAASPKELRFGPGDALIAYTDGAIEARGEDGRMLRIEGLRHLIAGMDGARPDAWPRSLREQIARFRQGPPADDTLFLMLHRPVGVVPAEEAGEARRRPAQVSA